MAKKKKRRVHEATGVEEEYEEMEEEDEDQEPLAPSKQDMSEERTWIVRSEGNINGEPVAVGTAIIATRADAKVQMDLGTKLEEVPDPINPPPPVP